MLEAARALKKMNWEIITTTETSYLLGQHGIESTDIYKFLNVKEKFPFPPTLHPKMELALTTSKWKNIDLVFDTTYPVKQGIDVGGHTLIALACKGNRLVASNKNDMELIINALKKKKADKKFRKEMIRKAYLKIAGFYTELLGGKNTATVDVIHLMNGENPYQVPSYLFVSDKKDGLSPGNFKQLSGEAPCFTNMADFDCVIKVMVSAVLAYKKMKRKAPYIAVAAKHGNPCGMAVSKKSPAEAVRGALWGSPLAVWGGELITNFNINAGLAKIIKESGRRKKEFGNKNWMLDLVAAPGFEKKAVKILGVNPRRKVFASPALKNPSNEKKSQVSRQVRGGFLTHPPHNYVLDVKPGGNVDSLVIAWAVSFFSFHGGNEVAIAKSGKLLSAGGGPSTVAAAKTAVSRAKECGHNLKNSVFGADAFFPFTDAPAILAKAGCAAGIVPGGGKNFGIVKKYFESNKVKVYFLNEKIRGFYRH